MSTSPRTVVGVPGCWASDDDIVAAVALRSGGYLYSDGTMVKVGTSEEFDVDLYDPDPNLARSFAVAGRGRVTDADLAAIAGHTRTIYLVGEGGTPERAIQFLHAANGLLKAGGIAVKVESAGTAHRADQWRAFCDKPDLLSLLAAFVVYVGNDGAFYSCGMHNLGCPDVVVEADVEPNVAAELLHRFAAYLLIEKPTLRTGQTFSIRKDSPWYRMAHEDGDRFGAGSLFNNPFGVWRLTPVAEE